MKMSVMLALDRPLLTNLIVDDAMKLVPLEIKSTATPRPAHARFVVHSGERRLPLGGGVMGVPFGDV